MSVDDAAKSAETILDAEIAAHPLLRRAYDEAIFHAMAAAELRGFRGVDFDAQQDAAISLNVLVNALRFVVQWVSTIPEAGEGSFELSRETLQESLDILEKARNYTDIFAAYSFAHRDVIDLSATNKRLLPTHRLTDDTRFEAYNLLLKPSVEPQGLPQSPDDATAAEVRKCLTRGVVMGQIPGARNVLAPATRTMSDASAYMYSLPPSWSFGDFTLAQFRAVNDVIRGLVFGWRLASMMAASVDSSYKALLPFPISRIDVLLAVRDITALPKAVVRSVLAILHYGAAGIRVPDPVLQPLIPFKRTQYLLSTALVVGSSAERNLIALANMLPAFRGVYDRLKNEKEKLMRERLLKRLNPSVTHWHGRIPGKSLLPDVDLAIVDKRSRSLLLLELKWFIDPAEIREVVEKTEELAKGVAQARSLLRASREDPSTFAFLFDETAPELVTAAVISANWIGMADVQDPDIPILNEEHFARKLETCGDVISLYAWLSSRQYLPVQDVHYRVRQVEVAFFDWRMSWYGLEAIKKDAFIPM